MGSLKSVHERGLNAPFGARCFMTEEHGRAFLEGHDQVLMHRLALGAL